MKKSDKYKKEHASNSRRIAKRGKVGSCKVGRSISSNGVRVVPVFRKDIDVRKLGRAALRLAILSADSMEDTEGDDSARLKDGNIKILKLNNAETMEGSNHETSF